MKPSHFSGDSAPQGDNVEAEGASFGLAEDADLMASDRVMGVDDGKDAFHDMEAAVKSADERVAGVDKELEAALKNAVGMIFFLLCDQ